MDILERIDEMINEKNDAYEDGFMVGMKSEPNKNPFHKGKKKDFNSWEEGYHQGKKHELKIGHFVDFHDDMGKLGTGKLLKIEKKGDGVTVEKNGVKFKRKISELY